MACTPVNLGNGARGIVCTSRRSARCRVCKEKQATRLCDGWDVTADGQNPEECSAPMCEGCSRVVRGHGREDGPAESRDQADLCPACFEDWRERVAIMTVEGAELALALRAASHATILGPGWSFA